MMNSFRLPLPSGGPAVDPLSKQETSVTTASSSESQCPVGPQSIGKPVIHGN